jgi:HK97 family phage major capsid protein
MAADTSTASVLTRDQLETVVVQPLQAKSVVLAAGPRIVTPSQGAPIRLPRFLDFDYLREDSFSSSAPYWAGENDAIQLDDANYDEITLLPNSLRSVKVIHKVSAELIRLSPIDVLTNIRDALVSKAALALDFAFLLGDGVSNTPLGLLQTVGRTIHTQTLTIDHAFHMLAELLAANANPNTSRWIMHPDNFILLREEKASTAGTYQLQPDPASGNLYQLAGMPISISTLMPDNRILLVDMSQVVVARDVDAGTVVFLRELYADHDQVGVKLTQRFDIGCVHPRAIVDWEIGSPGS